MTCPARNDEETILTLEAFVDGELDEAAAAKVREHLASCACCREEAEALRALSQGVRAAFPERRRGAPDDVKRRIREALEDKMRTWEAGSPRRARILRVVLRASAFAAATAAILILVVAGLVVGIFPDPAAAELARDHLGCIGMREDWVTEPAKIAAVLSREGGAGAVLVRLEAAGYRLRGALVCEVRGRRYVHLGFVAPGRAPASVYLAPAEPWSPFMRAETLVPGEVPVTVARIGGRSGTDAVLVSSPDDQASLARLVREQLRG